MKQWSLWIKKKNKKHTPWKCGFFKYIFENGGSFKCSIYLKAIQVYSEGHDFTAVSSPSCAALKQMLHWQLLKCIYNYTAVQKVICSLSLSCSWSGTTRPNMALTSPLWGSTGSLGWYGGICCLLAANAGDEIDVSCQVRWRSYWCQ